MASFRRLFRRALEIHRAKGVRSLAATAVGFVREKALLRYASLVCALFPVTRPYGVSGVLVPESVWYPHVEYETYVPFYPPSASRVWGEEGVVESHRAVTDRGDDVVIVGGGFGVSAVRAARESETGTVTVFEASDSQAALVRETLTLNGVPTEWSVLERAVGSNVVEPYGDAEISTVDRAPPSALPECDTLELDCEGSELSILEGLTTRPSALVVEMHPSKGEFGPTAVLDELERMGYQVTSRYAHTGAELTHEQLLDKLYERAKSRDAGLPPVVAAIHEE